MKWIKDTKIARKMNKGKIKEYRLNQKTEGWEILVDSGTTSNLTLSNGWFTATEAGSYIISSGTNYFSTTVYPSIDPDTCASKDEDGYIVFAKKEIE